MQTRWIGHVLGALINLLSGYVAIRLHLEQVLPCFILKIIHYCKHCHKTTYNKTFCLACKSKAIGFLKLIRSRGLIMMALFLQDLLTVLHKVSLKFQEDNSVVADVSLSFKTALLRIRSLEKWYTFYFVYFSFVSIKTNST